MEAVTATVPGAFPHLRIPQPGRLQGWELQHTTAAHSTAIPARKQPMLGVTPSWVAGTCTCSRPLAVWHTECALHCWYCTPHLVASNLTFIQQLCDLFSAASAAHSQRLCVKLALAQHHMLHNYYCVPHGEPPRPLSLCHSQGASAAC